MTYKNPQLYNPGLKTRLFQSILVPVIGIAAALTLTGCGGGGAAMTIQLQDRYASCMLHPMHPR